MRPVTDPKVPESAEESLHFPPASTQHGILLDQDASPVHRAEIPAGFGIEKTPEGDLRGIHISIGDVAESMYLTPRDGVHFPISDDEGIGLLRAFGASPHSFGNRVALIEKFLADNLGPGYGEKIDVSFPDSGFGPVSLEWLKNNELTSDLTRTTDRLTRFLTKGALLDQDQVDLIFKDLGEKPLLMFLDFNAMGVANRFDLGKQIDALLEQMGPLVNTHLGPFQGKIIRLGGDEFAIAVQNAPGALQGLKDFEEALAQKRNVLFDRTSREMELASESAYIRGVQRELKKEYEDHLVVSSSWTFGPRSGEAPNNAPRKAQQFTLGEFQGWLGDKARRLGIGQERPGQNVSARVSMRIAKRLIELGEKTAPDFIMSFSKGIVELPQERITPALVMRALGKGSEIVHRVKAGKITGDEPEILTDDIKLREAERLQIEHAIAEKARLDQLQHLLAGCKGSSLGTAFLTHCINTVVRCDPSVVRMDVNHLRKLGLVELGGGQSDGMPLTNLFGGNEPLNVVRINLAAKVPLGELFGIETATEKTVLRFDLPGFGAINNNHDYDRGDAIFSAMATAVGDVFPGAKLVRESGGGLLVILDTPPPKADLDKKINSVDKILCEAFTSLIEDERSMAEWENEKERRIVELEARVHKEPGLRAVIKRWEAMDFSFIFVEQQTVTLSPNDLLAPWVKELDRRGWATVTSHPDGVR